MIQSQTDYKLLNVIMNDSLVINLKGKTANYIPTYNDTPNVILIRSFDTNYFNTEHYNIVPKKQIIELKDAKALTIRKTVINGGKTLLAVLGITVGISVLIAVLALAFDDYSWVSWR
jgi:hypothetical protein